MRNLYRFLNHLHSCAHKSKEQLSYLRQTFATLISWFRTPVHNYQIIADNKNMKAISKIQKLYSIYIVLIKRRF